MGILNENSKYNQNNNHQNIAAIINGLSGSGKSYIMEIAEQQKLLISALNLLGRKKRPGETDGIDAKFLPNKVIQEMYSNEELLYKYEYNGNYYALEKSHYNEIIQRGNVGIIGNIRETYLQLSEENPNTIGIYVIRELNPIIDGLSKRDASKDEIEQRIALVEDRYEKYMNQAELACTNNPNMHIVQNTKHPKIPLNIQLKKIITSPNVF